MTEEIRKSVGEHAWSYFTIHADQRLRAFHFFLIAATIVAGAIVTTLKDQQNPKLAAPPAFLLSALSFIFWKLDVRTKSLIWHAEEALQFWERELPFIDDNNCPHVARIFCREAHLTNIERKRHPWIKLSYSKCFNVVFALFGVGGAILGTVLCFV